MLGSGVTGIGYNPYMNGLGSIGLGIGSSYGSYGDMTMAGMNGMYGMPGMMGMGSMGMMGMYNPTFMRNMTTSYQDIEKAQLEHASAMHNLMLQNKTNAYKAEDNAIFKKSLEDSTINGGVVNLAEKIREGDADGICEEFDKLKQAIYQKYREDLIANRDRFDPSDAVNRKIEEVYSQIISQKTGETVSLRSDLKRYGETAWDHGFNKSFFGKKDYHNKYTEETINYLFDTRIDNKGGKDRMEKIGGGFGRVAEGATVFAGGLGAGMTLAGVGATLSSHVRKFLGTDFVRNESGEIAVEAGKKLTQCTFANGLNKAFKFGKWAALAALAADIAWQVTRD